MGTFGGQVRQYLIITRTMAAEPPSTPPVLETDRLWLRPFTRDDTDNLLGIFADPEAMRFYASTKTREQTVQWIDWSIRSYAEHGFGLWAVVLKETTQFVGQCGLVLQRDVAGRDEPEIGYALLRAHWKKGLATEAARACRDFAFGTLGHAHVISLIDPANHASKRVAEKVGMSLETEIDRWGKRVEVYGCHDHVAVTASDR
jgi:RimJ/RimL family protein N-acetyltransferase